MKHNNIKLVAGAPNGGDKAPSRLTYWRSAHNCFSIDYKGIITEICEGDLGYGEMNRLDGAIHAAIGCKQNKDGKCRLKQV